MRTINRMKDGKGWRIDIEPGPDWWVTILRSVGEHNCERLFIGRFRRRHGNAAKRARGVVRALLDSGIDLNTVTQEQLDEFRVNWIRREVANG